MSENSYINLTGNLRENHMGSSDLSDDLSNKFTKQDRLLKPHQYKWVFDEAIRSSDQYFTVLARPNELNRARLGLAITKKKVKFAVGRNKIKRITRESFRHKENVVNADFIVLAGKQCAQASKKCLLQSLQEHWQRVTKKCKKL